MFWKCFCQFIKRKASILMIAFMLGISNVFLEETRMVNDSGEKIEQQEIQPEENKL